MNIAPGRDITAERLRLARDWHRWARENDAHWCLTLALGVRPSGPFDPEASLRPHLTKLLRNVAHECFDVPRRQLAKLKPEIAPWFTCVYEATDRHGNPWPHVHGMIALRGQPEALLRGVLRDRWGPDENADAEAYIIRDWAKVAAPSCDFAPRAVVRRDGYQPSFDLSPLNDEGFARYALKKLDPRNASIITATEILKTKSLKIAA